MSAFGLDTPFEPLLERDTSPTPSLPTALREVYGGDWHIPAPETRPYIYANFVVSRDGRVSFGEPGQLGGGEVSGFNTHDRWLMALLRARADAVLVGDNTLRLEPEHLWTHHYIFPEAEVPFTSLRHDEGRRPNPMQVFLSLEGDIDPNAAVFQRQDFTVLIATTSRGAARAQHLAECPAEVVILELGQASVDLARFVRVLCYDYQVSTLLCEGGPHVYGAMLQAGLIDDEFLTLSPVMIGSDEHKRRPSLVEGAAFLPGQAPRSSLVSVRAAGNHLFLRSRYKKSTSLPSRPR